MSKYEWTTAGFVYHEFERIEGAFIDWDGVAVPESVAEVLDSLAPWDEGDLVDLCVNFYATMYYRPAQLLGPPERCYEAECDDERELNYAEVIWYHGEPVERTCYDLPEALGKVVYKAYESQINVADVEDRDNDGDE